MDNIGLDLHQRETQLCTLTADGEVVERRIPTSRERFLHPTGFLSLDYWCSVFPSQPGDRRSPTASFHTASPLVSRSLKNER